MAELNYSRVFLFIFLVATIITTTSFFIFNFAEAQRELDTDGDGIPDSIDKCPRQPETYNGFEDIDGCPDTIPSDIDGDGILDTVDKCPKEPENVNGFEDTDGCPDDPRGPTKVKLFAERKGNSILLTWDTPIDTVEKLKYMYKILKSTNSGLYQGIFSSEREIEEKVKSKLNEERFFYLDTKIKGGNNYTYQVITENPNDRTTITSEPSNTIILNKNVSPSNSVAKAYLIEGRNLTAIVKQPQVIKTDWLSWLNPFKLINAEIFIDDIFTTNQNPQQEKYRLALEPIPNPNGTNNCDQKLHFQYSKDVDEGQSFEVVTSIFEKQIIRDDIGPNGTEVETEIETLRHQKTMTVNKFAISDSVKTKWFVINPQDQSILNFSNLELQFDITGENVTSPDYRELTFWNVYFVVPANNNC